MNKKEIARQFLSDLSRSSPQVQKDRLFYWKKFLDFVGAKPPSEWDKSVVNAFLDQLGVEGYAPGTIRKIYGIIKRGFDSTKTVHEAERMRLISEVDPSNPRAVAQILKAISLPPPTWDMGKRAMPRVEDGDMCRPALSLEEIAKMVTAAKNNLLKVPEACYLAIASVYGLRLEELRRVRREHLDFSEKTISIKTMFVDTCKGGERRKQLLAEEIVPYLERYDFGVEFSPFMMSSVFRRICARSGVEIREGMNWHAFRRSLVTEVRDSLASDPNFARDALLVTKIFFRWRLSSSSEMADRYYTMDPLKADRIALEHHPVLALWR